MKITKLTPTFGALITDIDLSVPVNEELNEKLNKLFTEYAVLVFPGQPLSPPQFIQAAGIFGELMEQQIKKFTLPEYPIVGYNSTKDLPRVNGKLQVRGENYHTDHSNDLEPPKATSLVAVQIPSRGGDTQFVDTRKAFDDLDENIKEKIINLKSLHVHQSSRSPRSFAKLSKEELSKIPQTLQPLVIEHPANKRPALYLNTGRMEGIEGLEIEEAYKLIEMLYKHATQANYEYRHQWKVGDLVIWDNRAVMHQANADYDPEEYRYLYRIMLKGNKLNTYKPLL
jgi:taurine dioxygenase